MLNFIYYPVSGVLWVWHKVFGAVFGANNGIAWALSVVFLVFTLRLILYKPFVKQVRTTRQMQELQPQIKALQKKYSNDKQRLATEMQKLQREHGFNPLMGCLPIFLQVPVFLGLYHVLRSFNRTGTGVGQLGLTPEENANTPNYVFGVPDVQSFLEARLFGTPISAYITAPDRILDAFVQYGGDFSRASIIAVAVPLMIIASVATHFNARAGVSRQSPEAAAAPQARIMNRLSMWIFPLGVLVGGPFLPIAILLYWVSNNIWTYGQQHLVYGRMDREEEKAKEAALERRSQNAPKPGAKPQRGKKAQPTVVDAEVVDADDASTTEPDTGKPASNKPGPGQKPSGNRTSGARQKPGTNNRNRKPKR